MREDFDAAQRGDPAKAYQASPRSAPLRLVLGHDALERNLAELRRWGHVSRGIDLEG